MLEEMIRKDIQTKENQNRQSQKQLHRDQLDPCSTSII